MDIFDIAAAAAMAGGGSSGGSTYTAKDSSVDVDNSTHKIGVNLSANTGNNLQRKADGLYAAGEKKNPFNSISQKADYLFDVEYSSGNVDYAYANTYFGGGASVPAGGCTAVYKNGRVLRQLDWYYDENAEFIVRRPADKEKGVFASVGIATGVSGLTKAFVESGAYSDKYKILPFVMTDGINENGIYIQSNVVPNPPTYNINSGSTIDCCVTMMARYILDNCATIQDVKDAFGYVHIYGTSALTYGYHFFVAQGSEWLIVELGATTVTFVDSTTMPYGIMTNFRCNGLTFDTDDKVEWSSIEQYGIGAERFDLATDGLIGGATLETLRNSLMYSKTYTNGDTTRWNTEFTGYEDPTQAGHLLTVTDARDHAEKFNDIFTAERAHWAAKDRSEGVNSVWQTTHSAIYDLTNKTINLVVQENTDASFSIALKDDLTKAYVDDRDAATLAAAKNYTDDEIEDVTDKIDTTASSTDKLIPESKIDQKIATMTARILYKDATQGQFATHAELVGATKYYNASGAEVTVNENDGAFVESDETHSEKKTRYTVQSINPTVWAFVMEWTDSEIILNGTSRIGEPVSLYAPETFGAVGKVLVGNGEGNAPTWDNLTEADIQMYQHNMLYKDNDGCFAQFRFTNNVETPYSTAQHGTSTAADTAVAKALYDLGYVDKNHTIAATGIDSGVSNYVAFYGNASGKCYRIRGGTWGIGTWGTIYDTVTPVVGGTFEEANVTYYNHAITVKDTFGSFGTFNFTNTVKEPYNTTKYGTAAEALKQAAIAIYNLGYNDTDHTLTSGCYKNGSNTEWGQACYGTSDGKLMIWKLNAWQQGGFGALTEDVVTKVGGSKDYSAGEGIGISATGEISATQHTKLYTATIAAGATSANVAVDTGYQIISHIAKDAGGNGLIVDVLYTATGATFSIKEAVAYDITLVVAAIKVEVT